MQRNRLFFVLICASILACQKESTVNEINSNTRQTTHRLDIGFEQLVRNADMEVIVTPRSTGYTAEARGKGTVPSGEYAGWKFQITLEGHYSGIGNGTLDSGSALVRMRRERFESTMDPLLQSFCCGEGDLVLLDGEWIFSMFGQVVHTTATEPHNHLFAGLATTAGTMNMNIADQSGTVVDPVDPPHDPGIGLLVGFDAQRVEVIPD